MVDNNFYVKNGLVVNNNVLVVNTTAISANVIANLNAGVAVTGNIVVTGNVSAINETLTGNLIVNTVIAYSNTLTVSANNLQLPSNTLIGTASINATNFSGTANNSLNLGGNPPSYYTNASSLVNGIINNSLLNIANTTQAGITTLIDSTVNTSITLAATANSITSALIQAKIFSANISNVNSGILIASTLSGSYTGITAVGNLVSANVTGLLTTGSFQTTNASVSANIAGDLRVLGNLIVSGNTTSSGVSSGDFIPASNSYNLGNNTSRWTLWTMGIKFPDGTSQTTAYNIGGSNTQVQFNNSGVIAGNANFTWGSNTLTITGNVATTILNATTVNANLNALTVISNTINANVATANIVNLTSNGTLTSQAFNFNGVAGWYVSANNQLSLSSNGTALWTANLSGITYSGNLYTTNTSVLIFGSNGTINGASYTGTAYFANNASNFNGQPPSYYTNGSNISTGTVAGTRLPAANTTQAGIVQLNDGMTSQSITLAATANSINAVAAWASNASNITTGILNLGTTFINPGYIVVGSGIGGISPNQLTITSQAVITGNTANTYLTLNSSNTTVNVTTGVGQTGFYSLFSNSGFWSQIYTSQNGQVAQLNFSSNSAKSDFGIYYTAGPSATPYQGTLYLNGNGISVNAIYFSGILGINSTSYVGTAANATLLNNQPASYYTNASNISAGTLATTRLNAANTTQGGATQLYDGTDGLGTWTLNSVTYPEAASSLAVANAIANAKTFSANASNITNGLLNAANAGIVFKVSNTGFTGNTSFQQANNILTVDEIGYNTIDGRFYIGYNGFYNNTSVIPVPMGYQPENLFYNEGFLINQFTADANGQTNTTISNIGWFTNSTGGIIGNGGYGTGYICDGVKINQNITTTTTGCLYYYWGDAGGTSGMLPSPAGGRRVGLYIANNSFTVSSSSGVIELIMPIEDGALIAGWFYTGNSSQITGTSGSYTKSANTVYNWQSGTQLPLTVSFTFKTNLAGTYSFALRNQASLKTANSTSTSYVQSFAISSGQINTDVPLKFFIPAPPYGTQWLATPFTALEVTLLCGSNFSNNSANGTWSNATYVSASTNTTTPATGTFWEVMDVGIYPGAGNYSPKNNSNLDENYYFKQYSRSKRYFEIIQLTSAGYGANSTVAGVEVTYSFNNEKALVPTATLLTSADGNVNTSITGFQNITTSKIYVGIYTDGTTFPRAYTFNRIYMFNSLLV